MIDIRIIQDLMADKAAIHGNSEYREEIIERYEALKNHFDEDYPEVFLNSTRPNEEGWMKDYRRHVWESPSTSAIKRVENLIHKIRQADDFKIDFNESEVDTAIPKERSLKKYLTEGMPVVNNLEDWVFQLFQNAYLSDPNSRVFVGPDIYKLEETTDFTNPYTQIICSERIVKVGDDYIFIDLTEEHQSGVKKHKIVGIDSSSAWFISWTDEDVKEDYINYTLFERPKIFKSYPVNKVGTVMSEVEAETVVWDSVLVGALPSWNQALRRADDNNIIWIKYAYPKEWELSSGSCKKCKGTGNVAGSNEQQTCKSCGGAGHTSTETPFNKLVINVARNTPNDLPSAQIPTPPMGIVERPLDVIKEFREEIDYQITKGLKALGLENLYLTPLATSGESKIQDKKEVHTFLYQIAVVYVSMYEWCAKQIYIQRYGAASGSGLISESQIEKALPKVTVPTEFDILSAAAIADALAQAKDKKFGPEIINGLERDLIIKQYGENSDAARRNKILTALDPLPNLSPEEKTLYKESGLVDELDALVSVKLPAYVTRFASQDPKFWDKSFDEMDKMIRDKAKAELDSIKSAMVSRIDFEA